MDSNIIQILDFTIVPGMSQAEFKTANIVEARDINSILTINPIAGNFFYRLDNVRLVSINHSETYNGVAECEVIVWFSSITDISLFHNRCNKITTLLCP